MLKTNEAILKPLTSAALAEKVDLNNAIIWGVDPCQRDIFVAINNGPKVVHRIRKTSTVEYYHFIGSDRRRILQGKLKHSRSNPQRIIFGCP